MARHAVIVKTSGGWVAATAKSVDEAKALAAGPNYGLGGALRTHGDHIGNHLSGDAFVVEVVSGASLD